MNEDGTKRADDFIDIDSPEGDRLEEEAQAMKFKATCPVHGDLTGCTNKFGRVIIAVVLHNNKAHDNQPVATTVLC